MPPGGGSCRPQPRVLLAGVPLPECVCVYVCMYVSACVCCGVECGRRRSGGVSYAAFPCVYEWILLP